jgi:3-oxoacyl-[acyl-carrier protein] reductase
MFASNAEGSLLRDAAGGDPDVGRRQYRQLFSLAAAKELGKRGITCNCVSPGATDTDLYRGLAPEAAQQAARQRSPFKRLGEPREIAEVVAFLAGDGGRWVSGQNIRVNGAPLSRRSPLP